MIASFLFLALLSASAMAQYRSTAAQNDLVALNYALTLENLEAAFYNLFVPQFDQSSFDNAQPTRIDAFYPYFTLIKDHENAHVAFLRTEIMRVGGDPVKPCVYNFSSVTNVYKFVATAQALENTGVKAYDGAINTLAEADYRTAAATIATVEARHAAYLNLINGGRPFPDAFDEAVVPVKIGDTIKQFIISCPKPIEYPVVVNFKNSAFSTTSIPLLVIVSVLSLFFL